MKYTTDVYKWDAITNKDDLDLVCPLDYTLSHSTYLFVSAGTQKLSEHDRDWGQGQLCEAGKISKNLWSVIFSGQGELNVNVSVWWIAIWW